LALRLNGYYFATAPANCEPGHGFYQFSPEFYFRSLQSWGFQIVRTYLVALRAPAQWYKVKDPNEVGGRITFLTAEPVQIFVIARKAEVREPSEAPIQSDYEKGNWQEKRDHLVWDRSLNAKLRRLLHRIVILRGLWSLNVVARNIFLTGTAVWPTSQGIRRVNIFHDLNFQRVDAPRICRPKQNPTN
jgi:hypothetical protein